MRSPNPLEQVKRRGAALSRVAASRQTLSLADVSIRPVLSKEAKTHQHNAEKALLKNGLSQEQIDRLRLCDFESNSGCVYFAGERTPLHPNAASAVRSYIEFTNLDCTPPWKSDPGSALFFHQDGSPREAFDELPDPPKTPVAPKTPDPPKTNGQRVKRVASEPRKTDHPTKDSSSKEAKPKARKKARPLASAHGKRAQSGTQAEGSKSSKTSDSEKQESKTLKSTVRSPSLAARVAKNDTPLSGPPQKKRSTRAEEEVRRTSSSAKSGTALTLPVAEEEASQSETRVKATSNRSKSTSASTKTSQTSTKTTPTRSADKIKATAKRSRAAKSSSSDVKASTATPSAEIPERKKRAPAAGDERKSNTPDASRKTAPTLEQEATESSPAATPQLATRRARPKQAPNPAGLPNTARPVGRQGLATGTSRPVAASTPSQTRVNGTPSPHLTERERKLEFCWKELEALRVSLRPLSSSQRIESAEIPNAERVVSDSFERDFKSAALTGEIEKRARRGILLELEMLDKIVLPRLWKALPIEEFRGITAQARAHLSSATSIFR